MNNSRKSLVIDAFNKLDTDKDGFILYKDLKSLFSAKNHPDVL